MTLNISKNSVFNGARIRLSRKWLSVRKSIWHYILRSAKQKSCAVFLVGSGRSGTDILVHSLGQSLSIKVINEYDQLAFENWRLKDLDIVKQVVTSAGAPVVLIKPIVETMRVKELLDTFPGSQGLFLIRDYRDAVNSMVSFFGENHVRAVNSWIESDFSKFPMVPDDLKSLARKVWKDDRSVECACGIYWLLYNSSYLFLDLKLDERINIVNYESLVLKSEDTLREVCEFLGLKYNSTMIADIYSTSVKRKPAPLLPALLQEHCEQTWERLKKSGDLT